MSVRRMRLGDDFVQPPEMALHFCEFILEVEQDAVVEVGEFAVERFRTGCGGGEGECEFFVAGDGVLGEVGGVGSWWAVRSLGWWVRGNLGAR